MEYGDKIKAAEEIMNHALTALVCFDDPAYGPTSEEFTVAMEHLRNWRMRYGDAQTIDQINEY